MLDNFTKRFDNKHAPKTAVIFVTAVLLIAILLTFLSSLLPSNIRMPDMTSNKMYTLSKETKNALSSVSQKVELYLLASETNANESIKVFMERYACENENITFKLLDPEKEVYKISEYLSSEPTPNSILAVCGENFRFIDYYELFSFSPESYQLAYLDYYQACQYDSTLSSSIDLQTYAVMMGLYDEFVYEGKITSAIKYITAESTEKIYVLSGHGESYITYDLISRGGNDCIGFNIHDADALAIPSDVECVFLVCTTDITEAEATHLSDYMNKGGRLIVLTGFGYDELPNFYALAEKFGLTTESKLVCDDTEGANYGGSNYTLVPSALSDNIKSVLSENNATLILSSCTPITISQTLPSGITATPIVSTSANAYLKPASATSYDFSEATDTRAVRHLAVEATNENGGGITWFSSFACIVDSYDVFSLFGNKLVLIDLFNDTTNNALRNNIAPVSRSTAPLEAPMPFTVTFMVVFCGIIPIGLISVCIIKRKRLYSTK